jgi:organic radical activating enzyme
VLWLQITGGEPMIDKLFAATYSLAYEFGMMIEILTNGSRLSNPLMLDLLTSYRPTASRSVCTARLKRATTA